MVKVDDIEDPMEPCDWILKKVPKNDLLLHFKIKDFDNVTKFLVNVALSRGKLGKVKIIFRIIYLFFYYVSIYPFFMLKFIYFIILIFIYCITSIIQKNYLFILFGLLF